MAVPAGALPSGWLRRPLCRRYVLGLFDVAVVRSVGADGLRDHPVHWAFGWLADGECEPLGAWIEPACGSEPALQMLADLKHRGVERIWRVSGTQAGPVRERVAAAFCGTTDSSFVDGFPTQAPAASLRRVRPSSELAAEQVRNGLIRAIRRQGSFASEAAVLDFVAGALQRTERRLDRGGVAKLRARRDPGAQRVSPTI